MKRTESGLFVASNFNFLRRFGRARGTSRTVTLPTGERAKVWVDDSRTVKQTEHGEHLDALVRPQAIRLQLHTRPAKRSAGGIRLPFPIHTRMKVTK
jgi:hypothetical protein